MISYLVIQSGMKTAIRPVDWEPQPNYRFEYLVAFALCVCEQTLTMMSCVSGFGVRVGTGYRSPDERT